MVIVVLTVSLAPLSYHARGAHLDTVAISSRAMETELPALVVVPERAAHDTLRRPVLYLLHGFGSDYLGMSRLANLGRAADLYGFIIVCPSGSAGSWYMDSPVDHTLRFETYIVREVVPWVDQHYPTLADRAHRGLCGISMGGHGALYLAFRHPDVFGAAASISGVLDLRETTQPEALSRVLGSFEGYAPLWDSLSVERLADSVTPGKLAIAMDCGAEDSFLEANRRVHRRLLALGVAHDYAERPGGHTLPYWRRALAQQMLFMSQVLYGSVWPDSVGAR